MKPATLLLLTFALTAAAQTVDSNSITVTVTRSAAVAADTALFQLSVSTGLDSDLTSVTTALTGAGIQGETFVGVTDNASTYNSPGGVTTVYSLNWSFSYSAPYPQMKATLVKLSAAAASLAGRNRSLVLTYSLSGSSASDTAIADARRKLTASLIDDAKKEASLIADSAGIAVGQILGIAEASPALSGAAIAVAYLGLASTAYGSAAPTVPVSSSLTVKFAAGH